MLLPAFDVALAELDMSPSLLPGRAQMPAPAGPLDAATVSRLVRRELYPLDVRTGCGWHMPAVHQPVKQSRRSPSKQDYAETGLRIEETALHARFPPSTGRIAPVTIAAASDARKATGPAMSSAVASLPSGMPPNTR